MLGRIERDADGSLRVLAPCVGWWTELPHQGALLGPGSGIGRLYRLNQRFRLVLPEDAVGRISGGLPRKKITAVEYGQLLFTLSPVQQAELEEPGGEEAARGHPAGVDLPPGSRAIVSPTDGVFYRKPTPDVAPFVEVGGQVRLGQPIGLVEVMKTFNQILYDGPGFPETAEVIQIHGQDAAEVRAGEVLVVVR